MPKEEKYEIKMLANEDWQQATCFQLDQCTSNTKLIQKHLKQFETKGSNPYDGW